MLKELDQFIQFLIDHISDDRVSLSKKMKYGFRHYSLVFRVDSDPNDKNNGHPFMSFIGSVEIYFDNRNQCIEILDHVEDGQFLVESQELLDKWNPILEELVNQNLGTKIQNVFESTLAACYRKDLHREYKMSVLFREQDDEEKDF